MSVTKPRTNIDVRECIKKIGGINPGEVLVFQLPITTSQLSHTYINSAKNALEGCLPEGQQAMIIGSDIDVYAVTGEEALSLKLKGIAH